MYVSYFTTNWKQTRKNRGGNKVSKQYSQLLNLEMMFR